MMSARETLLNELIASLQGRPSEWVYGEPDDRYPCTIVHKPSQVKLWIWMGRGFYVWAPRKVYFGFWGRRRLRSVFRAWRRVQPDLQDGFAAEVLTAFRRRGK
jgi:hypothetical protein